MKIFIKTEVPGQQIGSFWHVSEEGFPGLNPDAGWAGKEITDMDRGESDLKMPGPFPGGVRKSYLPVGFNVFRVITKDQGDFT